MRSPRTGPGHLIRARYLPHARLHEIEMNIFRHSDKSYISALNRHVRTREELDRYVKFSWADRVFS